MQRTVVPNLFGVTAPFGIVKFFGDPSYRSLSLQAHITNKQNVVCKENITSYSKRILIASLRVFPYG